MSQIDKESLSALLDNEADDLELRRLLKACEQDSELLDIWERYSLVQSILHQPAVPVRPALSQRIAAQIETEAIPSHETPAVDNADWRHGMSKVAIAASVAVVFMFAVQSNLNSKSESVLAPALAQTAQQIDALQSLEQQLEQQAESQTPDLLAGNTSVEVDPVARQRLREYIESMTFDEEAPVPIEHIQDSPLYRLVHDLQAKP
ncbi:MAG: sigma-E factor negative regulatory protein [Pseudohongiella sp.]|nr:sigma-E factor negative regulatory protein [Pseudohongiella sp.]